MFSQSQTLVMGFSQSGTQEASPSKKAAKTEDRQTCLPVTLRSIDNALNDSVLSSEGFQIFGSEHGMLILVAMVESFSKQAASMELSLSDGTGRIKARYYMTDRPPKALEEISVGRYISAFGNVRTAPTPHFVITGMRVIETADEISYHMIESAHSALKLQRGVVEPATPSPKKASAPVETPSMQESKSAHAANPVTVTQVAASGATLGQQLVDLLKKESVAHPEGCALDVIYSQMKLASQDSVRKTLEQLVDDGEVFTTIDDEHFSCI